MEFATSSAQNKKFWFFKGVQTIASMPAFILLSAFVGFAGFARETGFSLGETAFMVPVIWALPSLVVLVSGVASGASLIAIAVAVALASVRLMPMVMALLPEVRTKDTKPWVLYGLSHFVAVTSWVIAMLRFPAIPREMRASFFFGFCLTVSTGCTVVAVIVFMLAGTLPPIVAGALFFLTPIYFLTSLWSTAKLSSDKYAMIIGLILGPLFHFILPEFDILAAGLLGGALAYVIHRLTRNRLSGQGR